MKTQGKRTGLDSPKSVFQTGHGDEDVRKVLFQAGGIKTNTLSSGLFWSPPLLLPTSRRVSGVSKEAKTERGR